MSNQIVRIRDNVFHIYESLGVFCTLILGSESALLIDTGFGFGDIYGAVLSITDLPIKVINTHGHIDHIQGNKFFGQVMLHPDDKAILRLYSSQIAKRVLYWGVRDTLDGDERKNVGLFFRRNRQRLLPVEDGAVIDLGDCSVEAIHTPGHTRGSLCLLDRKNRLLYSGDTLSSHVWLCLRESTNVKTYIESVEKVMRRSDEYDTILSSHSAAEFGTTILPKILHCAKNISVSASRVYDTHLVGKALLYCEGFDKVTERYGYASFEEFLAHTKEIDPKEIAEIEFTSIVYVKSKLS